MKCEAEMRNEKLGTKTWLLRSTSNRFISMNINLFLILKIGKYNLRLRNLFYVIYFI